MQPLSCTTVFLQSCIHSLSFRSLLFPDTPTHTIWLYAISG